MKSNSTQRKTFFTKERLNAIADILEKLGTALLIGVILGSIISNKGTIQETLVVSFIAISSIVYSVFLRIEKEDS